jgi:hypothetical protein
MFQPRPLLVQTSASQVPANGQRNLPVQPAFLARIETNPRLKARVTQTKVGESAGQEILIWARLILHKSLSAVCEAATCETTFYAPGSKHLLHARPNWSKSVEIYVPSFGFMWRTVVMVKNGTWLTPSREDLAVVWEHQSIVA